MFWRLMKSQRGSTFAAVLAYLAVLSILGISILGFAAMNYKLKITDKKSKTAFYLAESGLDEAYAILGEEIESAVSQSNAGVSSYISDPNGLSKFLKEQLALEQTGPEDASVYVNEDGTLVDSEIYNLLNTRFKGDYISYFNTNFAGESNSIRERLENESRYGTLKPGQISVLQYANFAGISDTDRFIIRLEAQSKSGAVAKKIQATFRIGIPEYNRPYYVSSDIARVYTNVLWTKALTAGKNIYVRGNSSSLTDSNLVNITGDVYAYGEDPDDASDSREYGGIIVGDQSGHSGKLRIEGNVSTNRYIHTVAKNSTIDILGDIYCNTLGIEELDSDEIQGNPEELDENCVINIKGNVNTFDDIELDGDASSINIDGSYYGFSYGSTGADQSSSIVVNSDDIGTGSEIRVTGTGIPKEYYPDEDLGDSNDKKIGVFIGGTVYIKLEGGDYQTGESVSVKGNYLAYGEEVNDPNSEFYKDNVEFIDLPPLYLVYKPKDRTEKYSEKELSKYLEAILGQDTGIINLGGGKIDLGDNVRYTDGAYITRDPDTGNGVLKNDVSSLDLFINQYKAAFNTNYREYKYYVNRMGDPQSDLYSSNVDEQLSISDMYDFSQNIKSVNGNEIFYSNNDPSASIAILGPNASESIAAADTYDFSGSPDIKGIIVTKGDVYLAGRLNFNGAIITEGNIYILDDNPKSFTNRYNKASLNTEDNYAVHTIYAHKKDTAHQQIGDFFRTDSSLGPDYIEFVAGSDAGTDDSLGNYTKYSKLIYVTDWKRIR